MPQTHSSKKKNESYSVLLGERERGSNNYLLVFDTCSLLANFIVILFSQTTAPNIFLVSNQPCISVQKWSLDSLAQRISKVSVVVKRIVRNSIASLVH